MDNTTDPIGTGPPAGSETSTNTILTRKRGRQAEADGDDSVLQFNRPAKVKKPKFTLESVMEKLSDMSGVLQDLPDIKATIHSVSSDIAALKNTTSTLVTKSDELAQENEALRRSVAALEARVDQLSLAGNANALHQQRATPGPSNELSISGLSFGQVDSGALLQYTLAIADILKVEIQPGDFTSARLLRKVTPTPPATLDADQICAAPPLVPNKVTYAVVCRAPTIVNRILAAKRAFGPLKFSQLDAGAMMATGLAVFQPGDPHIIINELIPSDVLRLLNEAKTQLKAVGFKYVWTRRSTVFAKYADNALVQIINSPDDLVRIAQLYTSRSPTNQ